MIRYFGAAIMAAVGFAAMAAIPQPFAFTEDQVARGRKSGKQLIVPLSYGMYGKEWVIVGSRGGTPEHPAWFLNLQAAEKPECVVQIGTQAFRCSWREVQGEERKPVWDYMCGLFDPYVRYEKKIAGRRVMPVIMLKLLEEVAVASP